MRKLQLPLCHPHKTLMCKQPQRILQFKLVDPYILLNVSFRRRNGLQSGSLQLKETQKVFSWIEMHDFYQVLMKEKRHFLNIVVKKNQDCRRILVIDIGLFS